MTTTTQLSDKGGNGQTAPHNPTTDDPFALIPGAYGDDDQEVSR